jgi:hypothetical protein
MWPKTCARKFILLALRRLVGIRRERSDIDQSGNALVGSRGRNDCSAVRMTNENGRTADPFERSVDCRDVAFESVETVLGRDYFVPLRLKRWISLLKHEPSAQSPWANTMLVFVFIFISFDCWFGVPERRVVFRNTIRNSSNPLEPGAARLSVRP